jgi:hypothetical protein
VPRHERVRNVAEELVVAVGAEFGVEAVVEEEPVERVEDPGEGLVDLLGPEIGLEAACRNTR